MIKSKKELFPDRYRALFIILIILILLLIPMIFRELNIRQNDFPKAERFLEAGNLYIKNGNIKDGQLLLNKAKQYYDQKFTISKGRLKEIK